MALIAFRCKQTQNSKRGMQILNQLESKNFPTTRTSD